MSDTSINKIIQYGTAAERVAYTPDPPIGIQTLYLWYDTDSAPNIYAWNGSAWVQLNSLAGFATELYVNAAIAEVNVGGAAQNSFLISGGQIVWTADYDFIIGAASYYINGVLYSSPSASISLDAADVTNDRIDVIAVDDTGVAVKITGIPAAQPSEPDIDPGTQLKLGIIFVAASSTAPTVGTELLYFENAGSPTEWDWTNSGASFNVNSASNPKSPATKDIEGTSVTAGHYAQGEIGSGTYDINTARLLILYIRSKSTWANNRGLIVSLRNAGVLIGQNVTINRTGSYGFDSSITGSYQIVAIPVNHFTIPIGQLINQIRITAFGNGHGFYIADISFQEEGASQLSTGITQAQAEAIFASKLGTFITENNESANLPNSRQLVAGTGITFDITTPNEIEIINSSPAAGQKYDRGITVDGGGSVLTTGIKGYKSIPVSGTITKWRLLADAAGDIEFDITLDDFASYPPTTSIVASAPPELTGVDSAEDTTLTGWTTTVTAGQVLGFVITGVPATITRITLELEIQP